MSPDAFSAHFAAIPSISFCNIERASHQEVAENHTGTPRALRARMQKHEKTQRELNAITSRIIGGAISLHGVFGPGLLESVYATCLARDLIDAGFDVATDFPIGLHYKDVHIACAFRADIVVNRCVLVELKAVEQSAPVHLRQLTTYLKLADYRVGLLLNFGAAVLKDGGIYRRVNRFPD